MRSQFDRRHPTRLAGSHLNLEACLRVQSSPGRWVQAIERINAAGSGRLEDRAYTPYLFMGNNLGDRDCVSSLIAVPSCIASI